MTDSNTSSTLSTNSPVKVQPLRDPARAAMVVGQKAPLGSSNPNQVVPGQTVDHSIPGAMLGQKALLAKKFASAKGSTISPTDALQSPCTAKIASAKQRRFAKVKVAGLRLVSDENKNTTDKA
ncbi:hypothetical protein CcaverHIS002_0107470 [Cutaneotrichosporon cavernicola]|uniref:Uncharacterized protein n=1 Tax=Cutaneotrichosporon cavernicola TaxID=279322 RepID=A0AA48II11_9TREE|nr:uncharacterized protein CcaverHIS019_0107410 [Cutaneotrichosporon cavernicola]BEI80218.1 hypothetical protein CcaverHIS002_0107470 [Cutaneotrichosporon cavernicola]BEI88023.1 hypothetical protein CcaverHIS019_0107410 [Cutaneotrichosporon cavernicola]BEI95797.1 hypothetical protein CcaverHIS631_0107460 [Cutaneotrichosporon cavernicola]BEJ03570.1 hypothetical protein CcaverHIS641_0107450 [Cutaneotrichosporon cavernicola]